MGTEPLVQLFVPARIRSPIPLAYRLNGQGAVVTSPINNVVLVGKGRSGLYGYNSIP